MEFEHANVLAPCTTIIHTDTYAHKKRLIDGLMRQAKFKSRMHYLKYMSFKAISTRLNIIVNILDAISVSSIVINMSPEYTNLKISSLVTTSTSAILSIFVTTYDFNDKINRHQTSYLQYTDIYRDIDAKIAANGLTSKELDAMLTQLNSRLGLIEDQSLPLSRLYEDCEYENVNV